MKLNVDVKGAEELARKLKLLDLTKQQKAIKAAGRAAFKPVLEDARQNVPVDSGLLRDSLRLATRTRSGGQYPIEVGLTVRNTISYEDAEGAALIRTRFGRRGLKVGGRRIKGRGKRISVETGAAWRWHFIETGVPSRGIPARPFLRPALARNKEAVDRIFRERMAALVERLAKS
jgi:HK97 gp10 family phage protein